MVKYAFISAAGHSGSTLLDLLLGSHSRIESLGEVTHLPKNVALNSDCMCGRPVLQCELWVPVLEKLSEQLQVNLIENPYGLDLGFINSQVVIDPQHQTPFYRFRSRIELGLQYAGLRVLGGVFEGPLGAGRVVNNNLRLFNAVRACKGVDVVVDSSKSYLKALQVYRTEPASTRLIVLTRDGRGVYYSGLKRGLDRGKSIAAWQKHYLRSLRVYSQLVEPQHMLFVKYENLVSDLPGELTRLCGFLGQQFETGMIDFMANEHHITNGNLMRFGKAEIRLDEAWRSALRADDLEYFDRHAGQLNRQLGYQ